MGNFDEILLLEYAAHYRKHELLAELLDGQDLSEMEVPKMPVFCVTLSSIIKNKEVEHFDKAAGILWKLYTVVPEIVPFTSFGSLLTDILVLKTLMVIKDYGDRDCSQLVNCMLELFRIPKNVRLSEENRDWLSQKFDGVFKTLSVLFHHADKDRILKDLNLEHSNCIWDELNSEIKSYLDKVNVEVGPPIIDMLFNILKQCREDSIHVSEIIAPTDSSENSESVENSSLSQASGNTRARNKRAVRKRRESHVKHRRKRKSENSSESERNVLKKFRGKETKSNSQDVTKVVTCGSEQDDLSRDEVSMSRVEEQRELSSEQQTDGSKLPLVTAEPGGNNWEEVGSSNSSDSIILFEDDNPEALESEDSGTICRTKVLDFLLGMVNSSSSDSELAEDLNRCTASVNRKEVTKHSTCCLQQAVSAKDIFVGGDDIEVLFVKRAKKKDKGPRKDYTSGMELDENSVISETSSDVTRDDNPESDANLFSADSQNTQATVNGNSFSMEASKEDRILANNRQSDTEDLEKVTGGPSIVRTQGSSLEDTTNLLSVGGSHTQMTKGPVSVNTPNMENEAGGSISKETTGSRPDGLLRNDGSSDRERVEKVCTGRESPNETAQRNSSEGDTYLPSADGVHSDSTEDRISHDSTNDENETAVSISKETDADNGLVRNNGNNDVEHDVESACVGQGLPDGTTRTNTTESDRMTIVRSGVPNLVMQKSVNDLPYQAHQKNVPVTEIVTDARWITSAQKGNVTGISPLPQIIDVRSLVNSLDSAGSSNDGKTYGEKEMVIKDTQGAYIKTEKLSAALPSVSKPGPSSTSKGLSTALPSTCAQGPSSRALNSSMALPNCNEHTALSSTNGEGSSSKTKTTVLPSTSNKGSCSGAARSSTTLPHTSTQGPFIERCEMDPSYERSSTSLPTQNKDVSTLTPSSIAKNFPTVHSCVIPDCENRLNVDKNNNEHTNNPSGTSNCLPRESACVPSSAAQNTDVAGNGSQEPSTVGQHNGQCLEVGNKKYLSIVRPLLKPNGLGSISERLTETEKHSRSNGCMNWVKLLTVCHDHCYYNIHSVPEGVRNIVFDLPRSRKRNCTSEVPVSKKRKTSTARLSTAMQSRAAQQKTSNSRTNKTKGANVVRARTCKPNPARQKTFKQQSLVLPQNTRERMKKQIITALQNRSGQLRIPNSTSNVDTLARNGHNQENESIEDKSKCGDGAIYDKNVARFDSNVTKRRNTETRKVVGPQNHITGVCKISVENEGNTTSNGDTLFTRIQPRKVLTHSQGCQTISSETDESSGSPDSSDSSSEDDRSFVRSPSIFEFLRPNSESVTKNSDTTPSLEKNRWSSTEENSEQWGKEIRASTKVEASDLAQDKSDAKSNPSQSVKIIETATRYENVERIGNGQAKYTGVCSNPLTKTENAEFYCNNSQRVTEMADCHKGSERTKFRHALGNSNHHDSSISDGSELKCRRSPRKVNCKRKRSSCELCEPCRRQNSTDAVHCRKRPRVQSSHEYNVQLSSKGVQTSELQNSEVQSSEVQSSEVQSSELQSSELQSSELESSEVQSSEIQSSWLPSSGESSSGESSSCDSSSDDESEVVNRYAMVLRVRPLKYCKDRKRLTRCSPRLSQHKRTRLMKGTTSSTTSRKRLESEKNQVGKVRNLMKICNLDAVVKLEPL